MKIDSADRRAKLSEAAHLLEAIAVDSSPPVVSKLPTATKPPRSTRSVLAW